jgi:hypothetical protein
MKKFAFGVLLAVLFSGIVSAQDSTKAPKRNSFPTIDLSNRANDHFMIQYGIDNWTSTPDSIDPGGFSRHFNFAFMLDKPFKTNPHFSLAFGIGFTSSNMFFKETYIDVKANNNTLPFRDVSAANHFKKYKLTTIYANVPVELRWVSNPENTNKSWKAAIGAKLGTLLKAYTKGKNLVNSAGNTVYGSNYIAKESSKKYFNSTMLAVTGRIGWSFLSLDASYNLLNVLKDGAGPDFKLWTIGITLSGL